ncbi:Vesicle-mediated ER to Golgi transport protein, partial [Clydaea vesicula]
DKGETQDGVEVINKIVDRISNSTLLEDRRASVLTLKGLAKDWKLDVGTKAMNCLINVLKTDRMDVDIINASLETLNFLFSKDDDDNLNNENKDTDLGFMFSEIYIKDPKNVTLLLDILEEQDFYVRFHTVEILQTLLLNMGSKLQDTVMTSPLGISRLIDLLDDHREIVRNEGLLLLISLTHSNAEIQKLIAFEDAFRRLFEITFQVGGAVDGGIIVQDCLQLTLNLLKHNVSNQNFFRETNGIQSLKKLLTKVIYHKDQQFEVFLSHETVEWDDDQKIKNICFVLEIFRNLVGPNSPNTETNQNVIYQSNILNPLINLALSAQIPFPVRSQALFCLGDIIRGNKVSQDAFSKVLFSKSEANSAVPVSSGKRFPSSASQQSLGPVSGKPAIVSIVKAALDKDDFSIRTAATYALQCLVFDNADMQSILASTFTPPPADHTDSEDSAIVLSHIVSENQVAKELCLKVTFGDEGEDEKINLLHKLMYTLNQTSRENAGIQGPDVRIYIGILSFISVWLYDFSVGVKEFFSEGVNLQFLVEQIIQSSGVDPLVQGLSSYLLGLLFEFNDNPKESGLDKQFVQNVIVSRIGSDVFLGRLSRLKESPYFQKANLYFD